MMFCLAARALTVLQAMAVKTFLMAAMAKTNCWVKAAPTR